ncbi:MAG TPA: outer membrane protein assembly factor BamD [Anaeromyxobacteraceae bacterium]|nr:outer membrane protein assembly factor BamD [Anaeromyxobacteraceae bacterium]
MAQNPARPAALALLAAALLSACAKKAPAVKYESPAEEDYAAGVRMLEGHDFMDAQKVLERVRTKYPYSKYAALAELRLADLKYEQQKYIEAAEAYGMFAKLHPTNPEVDYATFRMAESRWNEAPTEFFVFPPVYERDLGQVIQANDAITQFLTKFPDSKYVPKAKELQQKAMGILVSRDWYVYEFYRKREKWQGAAYRLERILKDYPGNPREPEALYELANMYARLDERYRAQQALQQLLVRFPKSSYQKSAEKMLAALRSQPEAPAKPGF